MFKNAENVITANLAPTTISKFTRRSQLHRFGTKWGTIQQNSVFCIYSARLHACTRNTHRREMFSAVLHFDQGGKRSLTRFRSYSRCSSEISCKAGWPYNLIWTASDGLKGACYGPGALLSAADHGTLGLIVGSIQWAALCIHHWDSRHLTCESARVFDDALQILHAEWFANELVNAHTLASLMQHLHTTIGWLLEGSEICGSVIFYRSKLFMCALRHRVKSTSNQRQINVKPTLPPSTQDEIK